MRGVGQADEQAPPVVNQRHDTSEQSAACEVLCCETAPAPLVLQFIEHVFRVGPITVQLPQCQDFAVQRGDQGGVVPKLFVGLVHAETEQELRAIRAAGSRLVGGLPAAQQNDAALTAPAG